MKTHELQEQRAAALGRMQAAQDSGGADFDKAETEVRELDAKIARARSTDEAERRQAGTPLNGDGHLTTEIRSYATLLGDTIRSQMGIPGDYGRLQEIQKELEKRSGRKAEGGFIPTEIFEKRVLTSASEPELAQGMLMPSMFINALTASSVVRSLGATVLNGLTTSITIPRETGSPAIGWVAENSPLSSSDPSFDNVTLTPRHAGALSEWSRTMLMVANPDVEQLLRNMLARNISLVIDRAAIQGGGANEPVGVLATPGIQTQAYDTSLMKTTSEMIAKANIANVDAKRSFLSTTGVQKIAQQVLDSQGRPLGVSTIFHGEPVTFSNQVPSNLNPTANKHGLIYGDWSELLIGVWSELDILVNPYESTAYAKGNVMIRAMATVDCVLRHPAAIVSATGVAVA